MTGPVRDPRSSRHVRLAAVLAAIALFGLRAPAQSPPSAQYGVRTLPTLGGAQAAAYDIQDNGYLIVGRGQTASGAYHAFGLGMEPLTDFGTLGGGDSTAFAIDGGLVVGQSKTAAGAYHAFSVDFTGLKTDLGTLGGNFSAAYDVRDGIIVGTSRITGNTRQRAFQYVNGTMSAVDVDTGGDSVARGVNYFYHDVVGYTCTSGSTGCRPFLLSGGTLTLLGAANRTGVANSVNDARQVVGSLSTTGSATHAFLYSNGVLTDLGTLGGASSEARAIGYLGYVVGSAQNAAGLPRAFIWRDGHMIDLNTVVAPGSGWVLESAAAIADGGQIVGYGTLNGKRRAFLLTPATDIGLYPWGVRSQESSNVPPGGIQVGHLVTWVTSAQGDGRGAVLFGARIIHTLTGPAQFVAANSYYSGDQCDVTPTVVTCYLTPLDTAATGNETEVKARATGPGPITHHATFVSDTPDPDLANNSISEDNRAVALSAFTISPATNTGGQISTGHLVLTGNAPDSDAIVTLTSSRPDVVPLPPAFEMPNFKGDQGDFHIIPNPVTSPTAVQISATYGLVTVTKTMTVVPTVLRQLYLTPGTVIGGCGMSSGRILLTGIPPASGGAVPLANTNAKATVPAQVTVPAGAIDVNFTVPTAAVTANAAGTVTAAFGGVSQTLNLTVRPIRAQGLSLSSNPVRGGTTVGGTVTLECPAAPGAVPVSLTSSNTAVAALTAPSVTLAAGTTSGSFSVKTSAVSTATTVTISAWVFGVRKTVSLTVTP